jgi:hypothetical protein
MLALWSTLLLHATFDTWHFDARVEHLTVDHMSCCRADVLSTHRDPFATFLAEYKRLRTHDYDSCSDGLSDGSQPCKGGHVSVIRKTDFNRTDFRCVAAWVALLCSGPATKLTAQEQQLLCGLFGIARGVPSLAAVCTQARIVLPSYA